MAFYLKEVSMKNTITRINQMENLMTERKISLKKIRQQERESYEKLYLCNGLYEPGSWLAKSVKTVMDNLDVFSKGKY